ncbi:uncharacterized protein PHALS_01019 [Plasmopara halstedii]|uniref:Uncharacterized protein n=1 Tax=Plasmopara halstedii TaxID=4781 RepID=A0A0P1ASZ2_PLAHL|nr:uncharacterized protein PHALS_01019 [Plasmopara halstedii]CEG44672.1 hypothetical protein PHALS_01019 [Plasmopara halstedii]|eukprot:XP_024581041.1 hypothetical protein PHALS_01019 [Plasmopara halstedii]
MHQCKSLNESSIVASLSDETLQVLVVLRSLPVCDSFDLASVDLQTFGRNDMTQELNKPFAE